MTRDEMRRILEDLGEDVYFSEDENGFRATLNDFEGFEDEWSEIYRDYDHPEAVRHLEEVLVDESISREGDYYTNYYFEDFRVRLGYSSFDI